MNPLDDAVLKGALDDFRQPAMREKIKWWLLTAHSNERWVQFEYGYYLDGRVRPQYVVACERARFVDLTIYARDGATFPLGQGNDPHAKIELKVQGNWYTKKKNFDDINKDRDKILAVTDCPAMALVLWFYAVPTAANPDGQWISKAVAWDAKRGFDVSERGMILPLLRRKCGEEFFEIADFPIADLPIDDSDFAELRVSLYGYRNERAKKTPS